MIRHHLLSNIVMGGLAACAIAWTLPVQAADAAAAAAKGTAEQAAAPVGEIVAYESLEQQVGAEIVVETTLNTIRRGTLIKYTNPVLTLRLGVEHGSIELSVPRETIRSIRLLSAPAPLPAAKPAAAAAEHPETH